ncbi:MAG: hypothetical protein R3212_11070 [Xanthomonadales bacterium]|nr:hypothetical protein [Xanthomonadales bacterium]
MKTQSMTFQASPEIRSFPRRIDLDTTGLARKLAAWLVALAVATAVIAGATVAAINPALDQYLSALIWVAGFGFFGLALSYNIRRVLPVVFTGIGLPVLAVMGSEMGAEFSVLASTILAGWLAYWIIRRSAKAVTA